MLPLVALYLPSMKKKIACIIPARLASTRFPKKILAKLGSKTLLEHVWDQVKSCPQFDEAYFAIDSQEAASILDAIKAPYYMTSSDLPNGTHRIIASLDHSKSSADIIVNWQADEPFIHKEMIDDLLQGAEKEGDIWTLKKEAKLEEIHSPNVVKVVSDRFQKALYFSRSPIPFDRTKTNPPTYKHIGLYAYSRRALSLIKNFTTTPLAEAESLEQLQFLENGLSIYAYPTIYETQGIDTPEDLYRE